MTTTLRSAAAALGVLVATFLGFGAVQELVVRGIRGGEIQPLIIGLAGAIVSVLLALAPVALWRQHRGARQLAGVAAVAGVVFHVSAALPPHRYVGILVLVIAVAYSATLLVIALGREPGFSRHDGGVRRA